MTTGVRTAGSGSPAPPPTLLEDVAEACRKLTAAASGTVFAVPEADAELALQAEQAGGARYDTILSFMRTPGVADVEVFVAAMERVLAEEGWIFMVEPAPARPGAVRSRLAARLRRRSSRRRSGTDVVAALWSGGLVVTDLYRRKAPSAPAAWRHYVVLKARRESPRAEDR